MASGDARAARELRRRLGGAGEERHGIAVGGEPTRERRPVAGADPDRRVAGSVGGPDDTGPAGGQDDVAAGVALPVHLDGDYRQVFRVQAQRFSMVAVALDRQRRTDARGLRASTCRGAA